MTSALELITVMRSDQTFQDRITTACDLLQITPTPDLRLQAAVTLVCDVATDGHGSVDTTPITDAQLLAAVGEQSGKTVEAAALAALLPTEVRVVKPSFAVAGDAQETIDTLQAQISAISDENRVLAAKIAAFEGDDALAGSLLTGDPDPEPGESSKPSISGTGRAAQTHPA